MEIKYSLTKTPKEKPKDESKLGFGHIFTDHMIRKFVRMARLN